MGPSSYSPVYSRSALLSVYSLHLWSRDINWFIIHRIKRTPRTRGRQILRPRNNRLLRLSCRVGEFSCCDIVGIHEVVRICSKWKNIGVHYDRKRPEKKGKECGGQHSDRTKGGDSFIFVPGKYICISV